MKKLLSPVLFFAALLFTTSTHAQTKEDKLDLPGDNLNLYAVLKLFQESKTLEGFEKKLNDEETKINNLDLNGDDKIDYIKVIDNVDGDVHTIVLQVDVNENEKQDVAVFTVQKDTSNKVQIQLIGDEELYGKDYIIEPNMEDAAVVGETPNPGYTGKATTVNGQQVTVTNTTTTVIGGWPVVHFIFLPTYVMWHSPWHWHYYPPYWHPWRPFYWHHYWGFHSNWNYWYFGHYRRCNYYRYPHWNNFYYISIRSRSPVYCNNRQAGIYKKTYSRPQTRRDGEAAFKKINRANNNRLPGIKPIEKPVTTRPITRPSRPSIQPERPVTRPIKPIPQKPVVRPTKPVIQRPVTKPTIKPSVRSKN